MCRNPLCLPSKGNALLAAGELLRDTRHCRTTIGWQGRICHSHGVGCGSASKQFAEGYYRKNGNATNEVTAIAFEAKVLRGMYGMEPVDEEGRAYTTGL